MGWTYHNKPPMGWPLDLDNPINDDLVGHWLFNESSGIITQDSSGNRRNGTFGAGAASPSWTSVKFGSGIDFDGSNFITASGVGIDVTGTITVSLWANKRGGTQRIFHLRSGDKGIKIACSSAGGEAYHVVTGDAGVGNWANDIDERLLAPTSNNVWAHIIGIVKDGKIVAAFLNGIPMTDNTSGGWGAGTDNSTIYIGARSDEVSNFDGLIDNIKIWNRGLSVSEVILDCQYPFWGFLNPDKIPVLDQYYTVAVAGNAGIMTTNTGYWGPTF